MLNSPTHPPLQNAEPPQQQTTPPHHRLCDFCGESRALLYCRADSAKLCFNCDREVHSTNPLFTKHTRYQLCDFCDSNPASILCSTENLVLCQNCDWDTHGRSGCASSVHDRRSLEGFTGCPSGAELCSILGFEDVGDKKPLLEDSGVLGIPSAGGDEFLDLSVWETPPIFSIDDLVGSNDANQSFQAMGIPPLPKNRNTTCGKYKEEMLSQLREIMKLESCFINDHDDLESLLGFEPLVPELSLQTGTISTGFEHQTVSTAFPVYEKNEKWEGDFGDGAAHVPFKSSYTRNYAEQNSSVVNKTDVVGGSADSSCDHDNTLSQHIVRGTPNIPPKVALHKSVIQNRGESLSRYKEKRKTRRYDHHIRYESRKARAEGRSRIRGRFAKVEH